MNLNHDEKIEQALWELEHALAHLRELICGPKPLSAEEEAEEEKAKAHFEHVFGKTTQGLPPINQAVSDLAQAIGEGYRRGLNG